MNKRDAREISKSLTDALPGYQLQGTMLFKVPVKHSLAGVCFESSSFSKERFYTWVFVLPLYVPRDTISFNSGFRLGGMSKFLSMVDPSLALELCGRIVDEARPVLDRVDTASDDTEVIRSLRPRSRDPHVREGIAYLLVIAGKVDEAVDQLRSLAADLTGETDWRSRVSDRAREILDLLESNEKGARELLNEWRSKSIMKLGLEKYAAGVEESIL